MLAIAWPLLLGRWRSARFAAGLTALARPLPALILSTASLWFWHVPAIYDAASASDAIHAVEHGTLIAAFALFWRPLLNDAAESLRTNASRTLYLSVSMFATGLTAALITFADHPLYSHYRLSPPSGRSALSDQRLGGGMMWLIGTVAITVAALLTMRDEE